MDDKTPFVRKIGLLAFGFVAQEENLGSCPMVAREPHIELFLIDLAL